MFEWGTEPSGGNAFYQIIHHERLRFIHKSVPLSRPTYYKQRIMSIAFNNKYTRMDS